MGRKERRQEVPKSIQGLRAMTGGQWLKLAKQSAGISLEEMAKRLGITKPGVTVLEESVNPRPETKRRYEEICGLEPGELDNVR